MQPGCSVSPLETKTLQRKVRHPSLEHEPFVHCSSEALTNKRFFWNRHLKSLEWSINAFISAVFIDFATDLSKTSNTTKSSRKDFPESMNEQDLCFHCPIPQSEISAEVAAYADVAKQIIDLAVFGAAQNRSYNRLADFTDTIGSRVSGSRSLEMAIKYMYKAMTQDGLDVHLGEPTGSILIRLQEFWKPKTTASLYFPPEPVKIPHWVRGKESAEMVEPRPKSLAILGLGSSIGTPPEGKSLCR